MKIKKLTIHNIASIEDAEIDFTKAPLADSDVFLITGDTGSGKSTILDAISLALYANTPRMKDTKMQGSITDSGTKGIQVDDPRRLLREGTGEGFVELELDGADGTPYKAVWAVHRANNTASGRLQGKKWSLTNLRSGKVLDKDNEIEAEIARATGLSTFDQFCRTTLLAQGEFTRFLNSPDEDKAAILEKITGADIYAKIGARIFTLYKQKNEEYTKAKENAEGIKPLSKEERETKENEKTSLEKLSSDDGTKKKECEKKRDYLKEKKRLQGLIEDAKEKLKTAEEVVKTEEFVQKSTLIKEFEDTVEVRTDLSTFEKKSQEAIEATKVIDMLSEEYVTVRAGLEYLKQERLEKQRRLDDIQAALEREKPDLPVIDKAQTVEAHRHTMETGKESIKNWEEESKSIQKEIDEVFTPALTQAEADWEKAKVALDQAEAATKEAEEKLKAANLGQVRADLNQKKALAAEIGQAQLLVSAWVEAVKAREKEKQDIDKAEGDLSKLNEEAAGLAQQLENKTQAFKTLETAYEKVKIAEETQVEAIRDSLSVGDVCPVCQRIIESALPSVDEISAIVRPVKDAYDKAKDEKDQAKGDLDAAKSRIQAYQDALVRRRKAYKEDNSVPEKEAEALASLKKCGISELSDATGKDLKALLGNTNAEIELLSEKEREGDALEAKEKEARDVERGCRTKEEGAKEKLEEAQENVRIKTAKINERRSLSREEQKRVTNAREALKTLLVGSRWEHDWAQDLKAFGDNLRTAVETHESNKGQEDSLNKSLNEELKPKIEAVEAHLKAVEDKKPDWKSLKEAAPEEIPSIRKKADDLKVALLGSLQDLEGAKKEAEEAEGKVKTFLDSRPYFTKEDLMKLSSYGKEVIDEMKKEVEEDLAAVRDAKTVKHTHEESLSELDKTRPEIEEGTTEEALQVTIEGYETSINGRAGQIALIQQELDDDLDNVKQHGDLLKKAQDLKLISERWERLNDLFGSADGKKFRKLAQSYVLGSLVNAANEYMTTVTDRYTLKVHPGTFIIELEDAYQGYASRVASTISGGESFLVSLSLALALSDIGTGLSVDTLFIDEGFGTLSGDPLQRAVDTLKSLNKHVGRHVGIISHIKELREKIPVKIVVSREGQSSASTVDVRDHD